MKIAICDDDVTFLEYFKAKLSGLVSEDCEITSYVSGRKCLDEVLEYDAVFLDIDVPDVNGLEIAGHINKNASAVIIFVTQHDALVYSSIRFQPFRFIRKSHIDEELPEAVNALAQKKRSGKMIFKTKLGNTVIEPNKLIYIEIYVHRLMFYTVNNEPLEGYGSLTPLEKQLAPLDFIRIHNSYLVNCKFIYSIETNKVILDNKTELPLSKHRSEKVERLFADYLRRSV